MRPHCHRVRADETRAFSSCVAPERCNPASHGNITVREECACGAIRHHNVNQRHRERSPWSTPEQEGRSTPTPPRLPCGCPLDSGCDSFHMLWERR